MKQNTGRIRLRDYLDRDEAWGREEGRLVYPRLLAHVEREPAVSAFAVSVQGVRRFDISFASEALVELARRYRRTKGLWFADLKDETLIENLAAAAEKKAQPFFIWSEDSPRLIGAQPSAGCAAALKLALARPSIRASELAGATPGLSVPNASTKLKQLWEQGFLLRRDANAESGGLEFVYERIK